MAERFVVKAGQRAPLKRPYLTAALLLVSAAAILAIVGPARPWNEMKVDADAVGNGTWDDNGTDGVFAHAGHFGAWFMAYLFPGLFIVLALRVLIFKR